jgi:hypothetical protein
MQIVCHSRLCFLALLLIGSTSVLADPPASLFMKIKFQLKNGTTKHGYIHTSDDGMYIRKDDKGYSYYMKNTPMRLRTKGDNLNGVYVAETDYHFHRTILERLFDTVSMFSRIELINLNDDPTIEPDLVGATFGSPDRILRQEIESLTVEHFFLGTYGYIRTKLTMNDISWVKKDARKQRLDAGGYELCNFQAISFEGQTKTVQTLLDELHAIAKEASLNVEMTDLGKVESKVDKIVEKLRQEKVIVIAWCSC